MNQILFVGGKEKTDINKVVKVFCVLILILGIVFVGIGAFKFSKFFGKGSDGGLNQNKGPTIEISKMGETVIIEVKHDKPIDKILYAWNDGLEIQCNGNGRTHIEEKIELPIGNNKLRVTARNVSGDETVIEKQFTEGTPIEQRPQVRVEDVSGYAAVKIVTTDTIGLKSVKYKWNNEEFIDIPIGEDDVKRLEKTLTVLSGDNTLTVIAINKNDVETEFEKEILAMTRPKIEVIQSGNILIIKATDQKEMMKITYDLNGERTTIRTDYATNIIEYSEVLSPGVNVITVYAWNMDDVLETYEGTYTVSQ